MGFPGRIENMYTANAAQRENHGRYDSCSRGMSSMLRRYEASISEKSSIQRREAAAAAYFGCIIINSADRDLCLRNVIVVGSHCRNLVASPVNAMMYDVTPSFSAIMAPSLLSCRDVVPSISTDLADALSKHPLRNVYQVLQRWRTR